MVSATLALRKFGVPLPENESRYMTIWTVPPDVKALLGHVRFSALGTMGFPGRIYCNKLLPMHLEAALRNLIARNCSAEMITWDGCFFVRNARGLRSYSLHSWGLAIDLNAATNRLGKPPTLSRKFVKCFTDAGFDWGGLWSRPDGMHFQLAALPE